MATDTESMHENMTRLRMRMVQQKLANERERLQRPSSESSNEGDGHNTIKLQQAMLRRQELLDRIRNEQTLEDRRPKTYSPRRRYTPSPLPPPSRRSLPDINTKTYIFDQTNKEKVPDMSQVKHVIEHQFRQAPQHTYLPPIQTQGVPAMTTVPVQAVSPQPVPVQYVNMSGGEKKNTMFNKAGIAGDFMDMMMLQNAQMHHMVMQQMMLHQLPGGARPNTYPMVAEAPVAPVMAPPLRAAPSVYHHHIQSQPYSMPPMDYYQQGGWW